MKRLALVYIFVPGLEIKTTSANLHDLGSKAFLKGSQSSAELQDSFYTTDKMK